jgi:serine/threonine protein kinase
VNKPIPFGKYYLLDRINTGGMAEVFRAKAFGVEGFERIVAVKRILPTIAEDIDFITMFIDEAKIAVQLNHANIAQIFDLGKVGDSYFIALEYVHGKDLRSLFDLRRSQGEPMPITVACYVIMKVCEGLDYAHNKRDASGRDLELVHRDVSPQNILISHDGEVKLIDFGIAKAAGKAGKTQAGILKGKFGYLSPEQVLGEEIDRRSDLFGIGIVLYELLTNERLFAGDSDFSTIEKVRNVEVPPPTTFNKNIPRALEDLVLKSLARDRAVRFQTAMELHDELQRFLYSRGESFGRRDLSAWMRKNYPEDRAAGSDEGSDLLSLDPSPGANGTDVVPFPEPTESRAVIQETRDEQGKAKNKSTILGMPAVPPPDLAGKAGGPGRSVPPPPPKSGGGAPAVGRSVPPPPPRSGTPGMFPSASPSPSVSQAITAIPAVVPSMGTIPSMTGAPGARMPSAPPAPPGRTLPPPPPGKGGPQPAPSSQIATPVNGASLAAAAAMEGSAPNPVLDMDWDDEELSTQIYDRPEDQMGAEGMGADGMGASGYESVDGGFEEVASSPGGQAGVQTYVPPASGYGAPGPMGYAGAPGPSYAGTPQMQVSSQAFAPLDVPVTALSQPPLGSRAAQVTQPINTHSDRNRNPLYAALAVAAVVLVCFVGYVFLAKTERGVVQLTTHPADATVLFDGKAVGSASPFLVTGVVPGEKHLLEVQKAGFRSWSQEVQVQPGQTLQFPVTLQTEAAGGEPSIAAQAPNSQAVATGGFSLETTPAGAKVFLDGNPLEGATPMRVANLVPRRYSLRVELADFRPQTLDVDVRSSVDQTLSRITLQPERVSVRIASEPPSAEAVVVRGDERRTLGKTPLDVTLENNGTPWTLEITRNGFEPYRRELSVDNGETSLSVQATLFKSGGQASAKSVASTSAPRAHAEPKEKVSEDTSAAKVVEHKKEPAAEPEHVAASSGGGTGTLRINSKPWSQVFVDGKLIGNTPQMNVSLPEGSHRITLVNPEFSLKKSVSVTIKAGQIETQIVTLQ